MSKDGVRSELEKWAEEERRLGLSETKILIDDESLEEILKKPVRAIRQHNNIEHVLGTKLSSADTRKLMTDGMTDF